ncbi:response regulator [Halovenus rubra]|uniref:Response regulator n=2 Tax=Halovenus rubra TaxID=869890 RepID=A0ACC7E3J6_9EURY|nr:response regulator transcription factor [Halovenus rubra]
MTDTDKANVLVVEDEEDLAQLYTTFLEAEYDVSMATGGEEALEIVHDSFDVVLLDRQMPDLSGDEVLARLSEHGIDIQVAMLTAVEPARDIVNLPFDEYKTKPITRDELLALVQVLIERATYNKHSQEFFSLAVKKTTLEKVNEHGSEEYEEITEQLNELRQSINVTLEDMSDETIPPELIED